MAMQGFSPVTLSWKGKDYTVKAEDQLMLIAQVEDALSGAGGQQAIEVLMRKGGPPYSRLAAAFGAALRYAGAQVSDAEIYLNIMQGLAQDGADVPIRIQVAILSLISILSPPMGFALLEGSNAPDEEALSGEEIPEAAE